MEQELDGLFGGEVRACIRFMHVMGGVCGDVPLYRLLLTSYGFMKLARPKRVQTSPVQSVCEPKCVYM